MFSRIVSRSTGFKLAAPLASRQLTSSLRPSMTFSLTRSMSSEAAPFTSDGLSQRQKRLLYRASQNGQLELDLMIGSWIQTRIPDLTSDKQLDDLEQIVGLENPDMINYMLEHEELPEELKDNALMYEIQEYTKKTKKHRFVNTSADGRMMGGNQGGNV